MASPSPPRRGDGILRVALVASLLVHGAFLLLGMIGYDAIVRAVDPAARTKATPAAQNEIVTITSPLVIVHRAAPSAQSSATQRGVERHVNPPVGLGFGRPIPTAVPGPSAERRAFAEALARHSARLAVAAASDPASAPAKYRLTMQGKFAKLKRGQGIYYPTRGWRQGGLDYYDASYEFVYPDGSDEKGVVPWPIHFDPSSDPFFSSDPDALSKTPLPGPPPGFVPPGDLGKALRAYFPNLHFEDGDN